MTVRRRVGVVCVLLVALTGCGEKADAPAKAPPKPKTPPEEIIIDNRDPGFKVLSGTWGTADKTDGNGCYGEDFRYLAGDPDEVGRARFTPTVSTRRVYEVFLYWSADPNRTKDQPVIVHDADGKDHTYRVNLQEHGNQWFRLGEHVFAPEGCYIEVSNDTEMGYCNADAVRLVSK